MKCSIRPRDKEILLRIYRWRFITRQQIKQLFFPSRQTAKVRIEKLVRYGLIREINVLPSSPIFRLTNRGEAVIFSNDVEEIHEFPLHIRIRKSKTPDKRFIRHHIQTNDFHAALIVNNDNGIKCPMFLPYYLGSKEGFNQKITQCQNIESGHDADAIFILTRNGVSRLFILEIDRGTQSVSGSFLSMIQFYQEFLIEQNFKTISRRFEGLPEFDFFILLIVTSSRQRAENIRKAVLKLSNRIAEVLKFFWITGVTIGPGNVFGNIWNSLDWFDGREYSISGQSPVLSRQSSVLRR